MFSHWMFEMLAGFDMFNDWYDSELNTETANTVSTYIIVEQIDDQLKISSYQFDRVKLTTDSSTGMPDGRFICSEFYTILTLNCNEICSWFMFLGTLSLLGILALF